ncbi:hypothetical protein B0T25DRAFT_59466 [Lasiosphaeria hispida]|uniref:Secreted protein n=1 Tax=Lasiosphaeria hispida TaxID=260671 RepID=A0AAJ0HWH7_9PEZI|nr:hypothetical protein B0T25DRAFT_59466 [Lasiosphaeria hispida]
MTQLSHRHFAWSTTVAPLILVSLFHIRCRRPNSVEAPPNRHVISTWTQAQATEPGMMMTKSVRAPKNVGWFSVARGFGSGCLVASCVCSCPCPTFVGFSGCLYVHVLFNIRGFQPFAVLVRCLGLCRGVQRVEVIEYLVLCISVLSLQRFSANICCQPGRECLSLPGLRYRSAARSA